MMATAAMQFVWAGKRCDQYRKVLGVENTHRFRRPTMKQVEYFYTAYKQNNTLGYAYKNKFNKKY